MNSIPIRHKWEPYLWLLPSLLLMSIFVVFPIGIVFKLSVSEISKSGVVRGFIGLKNFSDALRDPAFVRLTAPGVGVSVADAWYALHREESERRSAEENRVLLARAAAASVRRPREGGGSGGAALIASDYRSLPRQEQLRVKQRIFEAAARGEKLYP